MKKQKEYSVVTLKDLWNIFINHILLIILIPAVLVGTAFIYNSNTTTPMYKSTATLYILKQQEDTQYQEAQSNFSLALNVVNDCTYLLKSHAVLDDVITELDLDMNATDLANSISTANPENTRILEVTVQTTSPSLSKEIVDKLCETGAKKIEDIMGFNQVNLFEYGTLNTTPSNSVGIQIYMLSTIIIAVIIYAIFIIRFMLDDKIKNEDDVRKYLGLSVLGEIASVTESKKGKYNTYYSNSMYRSNNKKEDSDNE